MLRESKPDLRGGRFDRNTVPANPAAARVRQVHITWVCDGGGVRGLPRHVPRQRRHKNHPDNRRRRRENEYSGEAPTSHQAVRLHRRYHCQVYRRQIRHHCVWNRHFQREKVRGDFFWRERNEEEVVKARDPKGGLRNYLLFFGWILWFCEGFDLILFLFAFRVFFLLELPLNSKEIIPRCILVTWQCTIHQKL